MWILRNNMKFPIPISIPEEIEVEDVQKVFHRDENGKSEVVREVIKTVQKRARSKILDPTVPRENMFGELELTDEEYGRLIEEPIFQAWTGPRDPQREGTGYIAARRVSNDASPTPNRARFKGKAPDEAATDEDE